MHKIDEYKLYDVIKIDGYTLYNVSEVAWKIRTDDYGGKVVRITKNQKDIYVELVRKSSMKSGELSIEPELLKYFRNYSRDDLAFTRYDGIVVKYKGIRELLIKLCLNWNDEIVDNEQQRVIALASILKKVLTRVKLMSSSRLDELSAIQAYGELFLHR